MGMIFWLHKIYLKTNGFAVRVKLITKKIKIKENITEVVATSQIIALL